VPDVVVAYCMLSKIWLFRHAVHLTCKEIITTHKLTTPPHSADRIMLSAVARTMCRARASESPLQNIRNRNSHYKMKQVAYCAGAVLLCVCMELHPSQLRNSLQRGEVMKCVYREHSGVWGWGWGLGAKHRWYGACGGGLITVDINTTTLQPFLCLPPLHTGKKNICTFAQKHLMAPHKLLCVISDNGNARYWFLSRVSSVWHCALLLAANVDSSRTECLPICTLSIYDFVLAIEIGESILYL